MKRKVYNIEVIRYDRFTGYPETKTDVKSALKSAQTRGMELMRSMMKDWEVCNLTAKKATKQDFDIIFKLLKYASEQSFFTIIITKEL